MIRTEVTLWSKRMKEMVVDLATEARESGEKCDASNIVANSDLLTAYNGIDKLFVILCDARKRDDIPGDPFSQTVCIQLLCSV